MQEGGALFPMQSMQPLPEKARLFVMPSSSQELHSVTMRGPIPHAVNRRQLATIRAGLFRMQSRRRRWRGSQPGNAARPSMARRNESMQREPTPCSPVHAAPGKLCKFAQNRAVKALQIRPISTTRNALQRLYTAISNGLATFRSTPGSAP